MKYKNIKTTELKQFNRRDIRPDVITKLKERIKKGFNPGRPLTVVEKDGEYVVADGNHRLIVLKELNIDEAPCIIREGNIYSLSIECNSDEDTYAPEDLFDRLQTIKLLKDEGYTQAQIGEVIGLSREYVNLYYSVINKIDTTILNLCKSHQNGRVPSNDTTGTINFTERWLKTFNSTKITTLI